MLDCDVCVTGGGLIGLSIALELNRRGAQVTVLERSRILLEASQAAAGMLAANDPENPAALRELSARSIALYRPFLDRIEHLSQSLIPFQTDSTLQFHGGASTRLTEHSIDPRQLATALKLAVQNTSIRLLENTTVQFTTESPEAITLETTSGQIQTGYTIQAMGAWSPAPVHPRKGQMLAIQNPGLDQVIRTPDIYLVPRLHGPRTGHLVIGATVEDAGFSLTTDQPSLTRLLAMAAELLPAVTAQPILDQWAGLRPTTPDHLPLIGRLTPRTLVATGHYRNGILLAPATAESIANLIEGHPPPVDLTPFKPTRFA